MRLLVALVIVFTFLIGGFFNAFILDRIDLRILRNQTWHYGVSPHIRRIQTELTNNPNRLDSVRHQMRQWTPQIMGAVPNATGQTVFQQRTTDGMYFGTTNLADTNPEHSFQTDVVWEHQGLRPDTGDLFNAYMTAHPTSPNQDLSLFNVGYQGNPSGIGNVWIVLPEFRQTLVDLLHYQELNDILRFQELLPTVQANAERVTVHTMHFHPANFDMWVAEENVGIWETAHDQAVLALMSFLTDMEENIVSAITPRADTRTAERDFNTAAVQIEQLFNNNPGTDHAGFRAAATFAQQIASQTGEYMMRNFDSPFTQNGSTSMSLAQEFQWIWGELNRHGLSDETARRVMFIIMASTAVEVDAGQLGQINTRLRIHSSNRRTVWQVITGVDAAGDPPFRRGSTTERYSNWAEAVSERLQHSFGDTASPISRFATFREINARNLNLALSQAVRGQVGDQIGNFHIPVEMVDICLETIFVLYHLVMGSHGNFTVDGERMEYIPRNHENTVVDDQGVRGRFFTFAAQGRLAVRTNSEWDSTTINRRQMRFGETSPVDDSVSISGTLWFNRTLANRGRNQRLETNARSGISVATMFEQSVVGLNPWVRQEIQAVILNNDLFRHFNLTLGGDPVAAWANYQERVASLQFSQIRIGFVPGHRGGNVVYSFPVFASGIPMAVSFNATAEHIHENEAITFFVAGVNVHLVWWGHDLEEQRNIFQGQTGTHLTNSTHVDRMARFRGTEPIHISGYWLPTHQVGSNRFSTLHWAEVVAGEGDHPNHLPLWQAMFGRNPPVNPPLSFSQEWWNSLSLSNRQRQLRTGFNYDLIALMRGGSGDDNDPNLGEPLPSPPPLP